MSSVVIPKSEYRKKAGFLSGEGWVKLKDMFSLSAQFYMQIVKWKIERI